jgi:hypothetical protein
MRHESTRIAAFLVIVSAGLVAGCGQGAKDDLVGQIITDCQLSAHSAMEGTVLTDEKKHFALGALVEKCLKESGLQPSGLSGRDDSCVEVPKSTDEGQEFTKPLQKCWRNTRSSKG